MRVGIGEIGEHVDGIDSQLAELSSGQVIASDNSDDRNGACSAGDDRWQLTLQGLTVHASYIGDDKSQSFTWLAKSSRSRKKPAPETRVAPSSRVAKPQPSALPAPGTAESRSAWSKPAVWSHNPAAGICSASTPSRQAGQRQPGLVAEHRAEGGEHTGAAVGAGRSAEGEDESARFQFQATLMASPMPRLDEVIGAGIASGSNPRPQVLATSMTQVSPSKASSAWWGTPVGRPR